MHNGYVGESDCTDLLKVAESKLTAFYNPENREAVRFCVSHIILRAIALTKDPSVDQKIIKTLYDLASEILAIGDIKTDVESERIRDLINAMVEKDDLGFTIRSAIVENRKRMDILTKDLHYQFELSKEDRASIAVDVQNLRKSIQKFTYSGSSMKTFFIMLLCLSILYVSAILTGVVISYNLSSNSQLEGKAFEKSNTLDTGKR